MSKFLSPEWFELLDASLKQACDETAFEEHLAIGHIVTNAPSGTVSYAVSFGGGLPPAVRVGSLEDATVIFVEDYVTAAQIASGTPAGDLLALGKIKVRGDANVLLRAQGELIALGESLKNMSVDTEF